MDKDSSDIDRVEIDRAVAALTMGGVVAFPTETVYGLGADAMSPRAVSEIYRLKRRPVGHPLIVHISGISQLDRWARDVPDIAYELIDAFWPGPLTLVLRKQPWVPESVTGGQDTVALRAPAHAHAQAILLGFERTQSGGIAAPSANRFGKISPTTVEHVRDEFGGAIDIYVDGGPCRVGIESTILDLSSSTAKVLRPGMISRDELLRRHSELFSGMPSKFEPRVPGTLASHYAPATPLALIAPELLLSTVQQLVAKGKRVGVLSQFGVSSTGVASILMPSTAREYAYRIYDAMRRLDELGLDQLLIERPEGGSEWDGILDRLTRACCTLV